MQTMDRASTVSQIDQLFLDDVREGLSSFPKYIPSKYFYNDAGDKIFQEIMELEEYYLTNAEFEIFDTYKFQMLSLFNQHEHGFQLIEFGAGDGYKTKVLVEEFLNRRANFKYIPIDISGNVLKILEKDLTQKYPDLQVEAIEDDYFKALKRLNLEGKARKVVLFLGSNIGNFTKAETKDFLKKLSFNMSNGDLLMIGFDLKKDPEVIKNAYHDSYGVTESFNLNLLKRINIELGGEFDLETFAHCPSYDPESGAMKSFLLSKIRQTIKIHALDQYFSFMPWEPIYTEISRKYNMYDVQQLAESTGFRIKENYYDSKSYFVDSVWELAQ